MARSARQIGRLVGRRAIGAVPVLALVAVGAFLLIEAAPGDAVDAYLVGVGGGDAAMVADLRSRYGLDASLLSRLVVYFGALLKGDLGWSVAFDRPVGALVAERLPTTLLLMACATTLSFGLGTLLGVAAGARPGSWRDRTLSALGLTLYAIPSFWLGLTLALVFAVSWRWLPLAGLETVASGKTGLARGLDIARHLVLPVGSLALVYMALFLRVTRAAMAEVWRLDFVAFARARGLTRRRIVWAHVARNAALPVVTMLGLQAASMLGGSVVIESVFAIPGFGRLAAEAVTGRDGPLLVGVVLTSAVLVILVNLAVDVALAALDPRIGAGEGGA